MIEKKITSEDIDKVMQDLRKSFDVPETVTLEKATSIDKRAQGGATENQDDHSSGGGRLYKDGKDAGEHPADGGYKDNFARKYPMDKPGKAEGSALSGAMEESAVAKKEDKYKRGLTKAVEDKKDEKSAESSKSSVSSIKKGCASDSSASNKNSKKMKKAQAEDSAASSSESSSISSKKMKKAVDKLGKQKVTDDSKSSGSSMSKAVDANGKDAGSATPAQKDASASGSASGASALKIKKSISEHVDKTVRLIASAGRHLNKAFEDGSEKDLDKTGERLISAKENLEKAIENKEPIPEGLVNRLNKASQYFAKALDAYENDNLKEHVSAVEKSERQLRKAVEAVNISETKKEEKPLEKSVKEGEVTFVKDGAGFTAKMGEETYKRVVKALSKEGLYKSLEDTLADEKKEIDGTPLLKGIVDKLAKSHDNLRDALLEKKSEETEFKDQLVKSISKLAEAIKDTKKDVEKLQGTPNLRKSLTRQIESPLGGNDSGWTKEQVSRTLEKAVGNVENPDPMLLKAALAWDVDKDYVREIPQGIIDVCERIRGNK